MTDLLVQLLYLATVALLSCASAAALAASALLRYRAGASDDAAGSCS